jgi:hypothetical protein
MQWTHKYSSGFAMTAHASSLNIGAGILGRLQSPQTGLPNLSRR